MLAHRLPNAHASNSPGPSALYRTGPKSQTHGLPLAMVVAGHVAAAVLMMTQPARPRLVATPALFVALLPESARTPGQPEKPASPTPAAVPFSRVATPMPSLATADILIAASTEGAATTLSTSEGRTANTIRTDAVSATSREISAPRFDAAYLNNPAPAYPSIARRMGEEGRVMLRVHVDAAGIPDEVALRDSSGHPRLDDAAIEAVRRWRFIPASQGHISVAAWVLVPVTFSLRAHG